KIARRARRSGQGPEADPGPQDRSSHHRRRHREKRRRVRPRRHRDRGAHRAGARQAGGGRGRGRGRSFRRRCSAMSGLPEKPLSLMLVAGEPSGDQLGAQLMAGLKAIAAQGLDTFFPLSDTAVMGLREVVPKIPVILRRVNDLAAIAMTRRPDAVVLIDSPDFNHRIAARLKRLDQSIPVIDYVAPQVWASRQYRARAMARNFDLLL